MMNIEEAKRIQYVANAYSHLSDGAFYAALENHGIYPEDIEQANEMIKESGEPSGNQSQKP